MSVEKFDLGGLSASGTVDVDRGSFLERVAAGGIGGIQAVAPHLRGLVPSVQDVKQASRTVAGAALGGYQWAQRAAPVVWDVGKKARRVNLALTVAEAGVESVYNQAVGNPTGRDFVGDLAHHYADLAQGVDRFGTHAFGRSWDRDGKLTVKDASGNLLPDAGDRVKGVASVLDDVGDYFDKQSWKAEQRRRTSGFRAADSSKVAEAVDLGTQAFHAVSPLFRTIPAEEYLRQRDAQRRAAGAPVRQQWRRDHPTSRARAVRPAARRGPTLLGPPTPSLIQTGPPLPMGVAPVALITARPAPIVTVKSAATVVVKPAPAPKPVTVVGTIKPTKQMIEAGNNFHHQMNNRG
jgi:hypothetical protein